MRVDAWPAGLAHVAHCGSLPSFLLQVPVLVDGELQITESPVVAEYILNKFGPSTGEPHWLLG